MDWPIGEVARLAGTTTRTLRHYAQVGLLEPTRVGQGGYRYYDAEALVRLQRILLLRELGLGLGAIADVLAGQRDDAEALRTHLRWLRAERRRVDAQISSVHTTIRKLEGREQLMAEEMLGGFDHTAHKDEVVDRWGADAYAAGDSWWASKSPDEKRTFRDEQSALAAEWVDAAARGLEPDGTAAQGLARRQYDWLRGVPGAPGYPDGPTREYFVGLGEMYVADERFAANYGGPAGAAFVRDAMRAFAEREL